MDIDTEFNKAVEFIQNSKKINLENNIKLYFYSYYKQATIGDCNIKSPSVFDITNKLKYEAWVKLKGTSVLDAKKKYIEQFNKLIKS